MFFVFLTRRINNCPTSEIRAFVHVQNCLTDEEEAEKEDDEEKASTDHFGEPGPF